MDVRALGFGIPPPLGFVEQERLVLRVRALRYLPAAAPLLTAWFSSLQMAYDRWLASGEEAQLRRDDVLHAANGDEDLALQVSRVLWRERWPFGGGRGSAEDRDWSAEIISEARVVRGARNAEELLKVRDEREYPPGVAESSQSSVLAGDPRWRRLRQWAVENYLGAVAASLTVLVILGLGGLLISKLSNGSDDGQATQGEVSAESTEIRPRDSTAPPPGPGLLEEAGEGGARTYANPLTLSQTGRDVSPFQKVRVGCRIHAPTLPSVRPDGNWYRLLSSPWKGSYYAPANSFWNGDIPGQTPYTHNTDFSVPRCST